MRLKLAEVIFCAVDDKRKKKKFKVIVKLKTDKNRHFHRLSEYGKELTFSRLTAIFREFIYMEIPPKLRFLLTLKFYGFRPRYSLYGIGYTNMLKFDQYAVAF